MWKCGGMCMYGGLLCGVYGRYVEVCICGGVHIWGGAGKAMYDEG